MELLLAGEVSGLRAVRNLVLEPARDVESP